MRTCYHCGSLKSPCWRRGPPEKPLLCNACGAHYLVKKSLDGYMPGQRSGSVTPSSSSQHSQHSQQRKRHRSQKPQDKQQLHVHQDISTDVNMNIYAQAEPTGSTTSWMSASSSMEQDGVEVEQPAVVSKKRSRLAACSVYEVDPCCAGVLRCKRTFETADGCIVTVVRRMRKQLKPRPSCS